jgi:hypothetical protein
MMETISFLMPLTLLPGIGILIGAVSTRHGNLQQEIHHLMQLRERLSVDAHAHLRARTLHIRNALVSLHLSVTSFAVSTIIGVLLNFAQVDYEQAVVVLTALGIIGLVIGVIELVRESLRSHDIILEHLDSLNQ